VHYIMYRRNSLFIPVLAVYCPWRINTCTWYGRLVPVPIVYIMKGGPSYEYMYTPVPGSFFSLKVSIFLTSIQGTFIPRTFPPSGRFLHGKAVFTVAT